MLHFLEKNFYQEKGCMLGSHPGSTSGDLFLVIPDMGRLCKTWLRQQRDGFHISAWFSQTAGGQHHMQAGFLFLLQTTPWWVCGLVLWLFVMGSLEKRQELPEIWINV